MLLISTLVFMGCDNPDKPTGTPATAPLPTTDISTEVTPSPNEEIPVVTTPEPLYTSAGWYGQIKVSATAANGKVYADHTAGIFGELIESLETKDKHDIPGFGKAIFQVLFPKTDWGEESNDYFTDYRAHRAEYVENKRWIFQLKNQKQPDLSTAPVMIDIGNFRDVSAIEKEGRFIYKMSGPLKAPDVTLFSVIDLDNQKLYTLGELKEAQLTMQNRTTRTFLLVLGEVEADDYAVPVGAPSSEKSTASDTQRYIEQSSGFGKPPQL